LLLVAFLLVNAPNCHLSLVLASVVQGDAVNCNTRPLNTGHLATLFLDHITFAKKFSKKGVCHLQKQLPSKSKLANKK